MLIPQAVVQAGSSGSAVVFDSTLSVAAANFDVTPIAAGYHALVFYGTLRSSQAVVDASALMRFNGDTGANYDNRCFFSNATSGNPSVAATFAATEITLPVNIPGDSAQASRAANVTMVFPNYDGTTWHKTCSIDMGSPSVNSGAGYWQASVEGNWRSTAAITRVTLICGAGANFMAGSRLTVLGV